MERAENTLSPAGEGKRKDASAASQWTVSQRSVSEASPQVDERTPFTEPERQRRKINSFSKIFSLKRFAGSQVKKCVSERLLLDLDLDLDMDLDLDVCLLGSAPHTLTTGSRRSQGRHVAVSASVTNPRASQRRSLTVARFTINVDSGLLETRWLPGDG